MPYLLDTNIVSAARRPERQDKAFQKFLHDFEMRDAFISSITIMEIRFGIERERNRNRAFAADLERWLQDIVLAEFTDRIIGFDLAMALRAGALPTSDRRPTVDAMIAATAIDRDLHVVTRNVAHFEPLGAACINPWRYGASD